MGENKIELKSVSELLGMKFFIPSYQRGYRWTEQQVKDLLNDIKEFMQKLKDKQIDDKSIVEADDFYCLQPLVVRERIVDNQKFIDSLPRNAEDGALDITRKAILENTKWEVIDGQQRLTTIYILLSFLKSPAINLYSIDYETRGNGFLLFFRAAIEDVSAVDNKEIEENQNDNYKYKKFLNSHYKALTNINENWDNIDFYHVFQTLMTIKKWFSVNSIVDKTTFQKVLLDKVKFIWYESAEKEPIKVFTRLNIGKIKLTNAELIKALILNRSNFKVEGDNHLKLRQQEIASEWDCIEYTLQNDEFWLFLHENEKYPHPTRIEFIFELICRNDSLALDNLTKIGNDEYRTFRYFYDYFHKGNVSIKTCWDKIKEYYQTFQEWYNDIVLYHYIGYLRCPVKKNDNIVKLEELVSKWKGNKKQFIDFLIEKIRKRIEVCNDLNDQYELGNNPKTNCKPLLLLHNIQAIVIQNKELSLKEEYKLHVFYKFPFHLYKKENWDVEHIDSNTTNELEKEKDQKEWLKYMALDDQLSDELRGRIKCFLKGRVNAQSPWCQRCGLWTSLHDEIEKGYNDSSWDNPEREKNKIWNFVLLDAGTNRGYGNAIFPVKRRCIIGKDQGIEFSINDDLNISETPGKIAFIPPITKNVFLKYYNTATASFRTWNKSDAEAYKANILETLQAFGVKDTSNTHKQPQKYEQQ